MHISIRPHGIKTQKTIIFMVIAQIPQLALSPSSMVQQPDIRPVPPEYNLSSLVYQLIFFRL
jgi:hypothetical protein